jgi:hypothetical protein
MRDLDRPRSPGRRYESLCLATVIGRAERQWLAAAATQPSGNLPADRRLIRSVELDLLRLESSLEKTRRWMLPAARENAHARAAERFRSVAAEVRRELVSDAQAGPVSPTVTSVPEAAEAADPERCIALTRRGTRCRNRATADAMCQLHARMVAPALSKVWVVPRGARAGVDLSMVPGVQSGGMA